MEKSKERVHSLEKGISEVELGLQVIRGDNVAVVGELDVETEATIELSAVKADPLNAVVY